MLNLVVPPCAQCNLKQVVRAEVDQDLFGALDLRGAALDFQAERFSLQRLQEAQDPGRAAFSLGSPLYLNLFPVRPIAIHAPFSFRQLLFRKAHVTCAAACAEISRNSHDKATAQYRLSIVAIPEQACIAPHLQAHSDRGHFLSTVHRQLTRSNGQM